MTGNHRAARSLRRAFDRHNLERGFSTWQPAAVLAWESWVDALWHQLVIQGHATQLVLNRSQEHTVWRTLLEADEELASLMSVDALAEMASDAYRLMCSYEGGGRLRNAAGGNSDTRSFQRWALTFERLSKTENFISHAQVEEVLRGFVERGKVGVPSGDCVLVGFDRLTPSQTALVTALRTAGVAISELPLEAESETMLLVGLDDEEEELTTAARWTRWLLEQDPKARIAVIVPGLESYLREVDRVFREVLAPELQDICSVAENAPYEFSVGRPLTEMPAVAVALELLRWAAEPLAVGRISALLVSSHFAKAADERGARAEFDAFELRRMRILQPELSLERLLDILAGSRRAVKMPSLLSALRGMNAFARRLRAAALLSHGEWAERMRELLEIAGWQTGASESSLHFQLRRKWESALDELATLDFDGQRVEFTQALDALERMTQQTTFAPESRDAPVQVIGPLEAAGNTFDAVWFLRAGEWSWPMQTGSNSLLPWHMQRELGMPGTDIERDSEHARRMTHRIARCAKSVVFSYARESGQARQRPSPALSSLNLQRVEAVELVGPAEETTPLELETTEDGAGIRALPDQVIHGGARILELQAACGFRAFAEQRLWATELDSIEPGMDARDSGTVVHKVLEAFWTEVKTQDALRSMTTEERNEMLDWSIGEGLKKTEAAAKAGWAIAYVEMKRERLRCLLHGWLELELEREVPFEVKLSEKEFKDVHVGPLRLSVRMDRVDLVAGGEVLIDYKTGAASVVDWLGERPDAPQLPLYAILSAPEQLRGVAFGLVRAGRGRALLGYAADTGVLPKAARLKEAATLDQQVERWRVVLTDLAEEFHRGDARVRPKQYPGTCQRCGQGLLCRLDAAELVQDDGEDEPSEENGRG